MKGTLSTRTQQQLIGLLFDLEHKARLCRGHENHPNHGARSGGQADAYAAAAWKLRDLLLEDYSRMALESYEESWNEQTNHGASPGDWDPEKAR